MCFGISMGMGKGVDMIRSGYGYECECFQEYQCVCQYGYGYKCGYHQEYQCVCVFGYGYG